jgi:hypothetical protein
VRSVVPVKIVSPRSKSALIVEKLQGQGTHCLFLRYGCTCRCEDMEQKGPADGGGNESTPKVSTTDG